MTAPQLRKAPPVRLRDAGLDEAWLQNQIAKDPSLLGLGDLVLIQREKIQPSGGRLDLLMYDPQNETRYEIEIMLGATNESHIIRTIEYWDVERQRYPTLEHRAVIVAEDITSRFFNVVRLLNRSIPLMAIQLSAFQFDDSIVLSFIRVLDAYEFGGEPEDEEAGEQADRAYWEKRASAESLAVVDGIVTLIKAVGEPRVTFNKTHIAAGTSGYNFCWFNPPKTAARCLVRFKVPAEERAAIVEKLLGSGVDAKNRGKTSVGCLLSKNDLVEHRIEIEELVKRAELWSQR